jgi:phosphinothricin acetyltransferase
MEMGREIRVARSADADALAGIYAPYVAGTAISFEVEPPSAEEMGARLAACLTRTPWLLLCDGGEALGFAYAARHRERAAYRWSVDATVYVREDARRRGIGRSLYKSLFALLRLQGFFVAHAGITLPNAASVRLHESLGFEPVGVYAAVGYKNGRWHDVAWWRLPLREPVPAPAEPLSFDELVRSPGYGAALGAGLGSERTATRSRGGITIGPAGPDDLESIRELLIQAELPTAGLTDQFPAGYALARRGAQVVGVAGLETYGAVGLLRSVAVAPALRNCGVGSALVEDRLAAARATSLVAVYLLTTSAADYFRNFGFSLAVREGAPADLTASPEFSSACPASATCMQLRLRP